MDLGLQDKVCVVTGSTAGIGLEVARLLAGGGRARRHVRAGATTGSASCTSAPTSSRPGEPERLIATTLERFGRVDCLVNNVGCAEIRRFDELTDDDWEQSWQLNVMSAVRATRAVLPGHARARRAARSSNVSSTAAKRPSTGDARLLGDEGGDALALAARRRPLREGRDPLQRRHARADRDRRLARRGRARRPAGRPRARCSRRSAPGGRSAGSREPEEIAAVIVFLLLRPRELRHRRRLERRRRHRPDHHLTVATLRIGTAVTRTRYVDPREAGEPSRGVRARPP